MASVVSVKSGNWNDPTVWSTNSVPSSGDDVTINAGHTVTVNVSSVTVRSLRVLGTLLFSSVGFERFDFTVSVPSTNPSTGIIDFTSPSDPTNFFFPHVFLTNQSSSLWDLSSLTGFFDTFHDTFPVTLHGKWFGLGFSRGGWYGKVVSVSTSGGNTVITCVVPTGADPDNYLYRLALRSNGTVSFPTLISPPNQIVNAVYSVSGTNIRVTVLGTVSGIVSNQSLVFPFPPVSVTVTGIVVPVRSDGLYSVVGTGSLSSNEVLVLSLWNGRLISPLMVNSRFVLLYGNSLVNGNFEKGLFCSV